MKKSLARQGICVIGVAAALIAVMVLAMGFGRYSISIGQIINTLLPKGFAMEEVDPNVKTVIYSIRLPRVLLAALAGGGLAVSGAEYFFQSAGDTGYSGSCHWCFLWGDAGHYAGTRCSGHSRLCLYPWHRLCGTGLLYQQDKRRKYNYYDYSVRHGHQFSL